MLAIYCTKPQEELGDASAFVLETSLYLSALGLSRKHVLTRSPVIVFIV